MCCDLATDREDKKSGHKTVPRNQGFSKNVCYMIEGSESMEPSGSGMEKIRIRRTGIRDKHTRPATMFTTILSSSPHLFLILSGNAEGSDLPAHENPVQLGL
jgi:hypothetical protein